MTTDTDLSIRTDWGHWSSAVPTAGTVEIPNLNESSCLTPLQLDVLIGKYLQYRLTTWPKQQQRAHEIVLRKFQQAVGARRLTCEVFLEGVAGAMAGYTGNRTEQNRLMVRTFEIWLNKCGYTNSSWTHMVKSQKVEVIRRTPVAYSEYCALLGASYDPKITHLLKVMWMTGFALVDACLLEWGQIDMQQLVIRKVREKTKNPSKTPCIIIIVHGSDLHLHLEALYRDRLKTVGQYPSVNGHHYVDNDLSALYLRKAANKTQASLDRLTHNLGMRKIRWHDFRATFCTAAMAVSDPVTVSVSTGHADPKQLAHYATPSLDKQREMAEAADKWARNGGKA
jgi:integrase